MPFFIITLPALSCLPLKLLLIVVECIKNHLSRMILQLLLWQHFADEILLTW